MHNTYEKHTKIALKIVWVGDYLLGSVGIPETHPFLFGITVTVVRTDYYCCGIRK